PRSTPPVWNGTTATARPDPISTSPSATPRFGHPAKRRWVYLSSMRRGPGACKQTRRTAGHQPVTKTKRGAAHPARRPAFETVGSAGDQAFGLRGGRGVAVLDVGPVHDIPERLGEIDLDVLVLQIKGVLPHVQQQQWNDAQREVGLV